MLGLSAAAEEAVVAEAKAMGGVYRPPSQPPAAKPGQAAKSDAAVEKPAEAPANPEPEVEAPADDGTSAAEGGEPESAASVPDHSWVPEEHRAAYAGLPEETRALLEKWKPVMLERDYRLKTAEMARERKDIEALRAKALELDRLTGDSAAYLDFLKSRNGKSTEPETREAKPAAKASTGYPKFSDYDNEDDHAAAVAEWNTRQIAAALAERDKPAQRERAIEEKSAAYRDSLGATVTDEQFDKATTLFARAARQKGKDPYAVLEAAGDVEIALAPWVFLVTHASPVKPAEAKPVPPAAKAASVKGQGAAPKAKPLTAWEANGRTFEQATDEDILAEAHRRHDEMIGNATRAFQRAG